MFAKLGRAGLALAIGASLVPQPAHAATIQVVLKNHFFEPAAIVAQPGDRIALYNVGSPKEVESYVGQTIAPFTIGTYQTVELTWDGADTGLFANDTDPRSPDRATVNGGVCSGMCFWVSATGPEFFPQPPVFSLPSPNDPVQGNTVHFVGSAAHASRVRIRDAAGNRTFYADVNGSGGWTVANTFTNGSHTITAIGMHSQGYESAPTSLTFTVQGGDIEPPRVHPGNPARVLGTPTPLVLFGSIYVGHGAIPVNGVITDDVVAKRVEASLRDANLPDTTVAVALTCSTEAGETIPCDAATNPKRVQYRGTALIGRPGHYVLTTTATDGAGKSTVSVQDVIILSPI